MVFKMPVFRIYVEKKKEYAAGADGIFADIKTSLRCASLTGMRVLNRYDVEGVSREVFEMAKPTILSEPQVDITYEELPDLPGGARVFAAEYLPGQYDQRADSCEQCIQILTQGERPRVCTARVFILEGSLTDAQFEEIKHYLINPVEMREASLEEVRTLDVRYEIPTGVQTLDGFTGLDEQGLADFVREYALAMDMGDIRFCQQYFKETEKRDPTITEIRMIDTYWSDHCRHTTFLTNIDDVRIEPDYIQKTFDTYQKIREELYASKDKPMSLMDIACIGAKKLKRDGVLKDLDESEEINACSVKIGVDVDGEDRDYLLMFKNETHNHPTEIEPFGGAATCLGGAIRDPLSGRSYVYQAMRVTGAADPLLPVHETMAGKLPQKKICQGAANGYSSYGNQIGLATGHVAEIYHPGYVAKRLEIGAVVAAAPAENVVRERPEAGDVVILLGGRTGRDGCGGATGSSKSHTLESLERCGAEVQKGNPPEERKIQRLFRNPEVTRMIRRCNDFGAGGVSVAIGELADGLVIDLDKVPKKYDGLDGTELAISESQERMAVVVRKADAARFIAEARRENLEATQVAVVTDQNRLQMSWNGKQIVDLDRAFIGSNGASRHTAIEVETPLVRTPVKGGGAENRRERWKAMIGDLNVCSQKGLVERFDSTIGANTVLMPFGGKFQLTPTQAMVAKIPLERGETKTASVLAYGYDPFIAEQSPYHGAMLAVVESVARIVAAGGSMDRCWLTFQEYFERTKNDPKRWGQPFAALLGALQAQLSLGIGSIGGKDSMSGTFEDIDVPPTLVSFAVSTANTDRVVSPEFKASGNKVVYLAPQYDENGLPVFESVKEIFAKVEALIADGSAKAVWTISGGGIAEGVTKMCLGNRLGFKFDKPMTDEALFTPVRGAFLVEVDRALQTGGETIGAVTDKYEIVCGDLSLSMNELQKLWEDKLEPVYPCNIKTRGDRPNTYVNVCKEHRSAAIGIAKPRVLIPVFPGTNCEYDTAKAFENAGARAEIFVIKNLTPHDIEESVAEMARRIGHSQIVMIPGGFSGGDEPDGSGKFITSFFRNPAIKDSVHALLGKRDGLMLGICNGFQALVKLGLVPYGEIRDAEENSPTLTFNTIDRHQSMMVRTRVASNMSPWLAQCEVGDIHTVAISHGEGRFVADQALIKSLAENGQIATQYVDTFGHPTFDIRFNPNTSFDAIEGITSPDGRVFGKMAHSERIGDNVCKNVCGEKDQKIFQSGVAYFTK